MFGGKEIIGSVFVLVLAMGLTAASARQIYVDSDATGDNDGSSWEHSYNHLSDALAAAIGGDEIQVAQGVYRPDQGAGVTAGDREATFQLISGVALKGGHAGFGEPNPNARDIRLYETVLSGDLGNNDAPVANPKDLPNEPTRQENSYHVVVGSGTDETAALDGFTIVGGNARGAFAMDNHRLFGGGMYNWSGSPTVTDCTFRNNSANHFGGGMCNRQGSHPTVSRCTFISNGTANVVYIKDEDESTGGGAADVTGSSSVYSGCVFEGNWSRHAGGVGMAWDSNLTLERCLFIGNSAWSGGGICALFNCSPRLSRCEFIKNSALYFGGGFRCYADCNPILEHCEFVGNSAEDIGGAVASQVRCGPQLNHCIFSGNQAPRCGGYDNFYSSSSLTNCTLATNVNGDVLVAHGDVTLSSCILVGDSPAIEIDGGTVSVNYSNIDGGWAGVGNIDEDPVFADAAGGDYHLKSEVGRWDAEGEVWVRDAVTSPCIDAGDPMTPIGPEPFPNGGVINMGAYGGTAEASKSYFGKPPCETIIAGDLNGDCVVDFRDVAIMMMHWLEER